MNTKILFTGIILVAFFTLTQAQSTEKEPITKAKTTQSSFVDANNDGVCDNFNANTQNGRQGNAYRHGQNQGKGKAYRNCNGNRNGQGKGQMLRNGQGQGKRNGQGQGKGQGQFVDADKNGVCDNRE